MYSKYIVTVNVAQQSVYKVGYIILCKICKDVLETALHPGLHLFNLLAIGLAVAPYGCIVLQRRFCKLVIVVYILYDLFNAAVVVELFPNLVIVPLEFLVEHQLPEE